MVEQKALIKIVLYDCLGQVSKGNEVKGYNYSTYWHGSVRNLNKFYSQCPSCLFLRLTSPIYTTSAGHAYRMSETIHVSVSTTGRIGNSTRVKNCRDAHCIGNVSDTIRKSSYGYDDTNVSFTFAPSIATWSGRPPERLLSCRKLRGYGYDESCWPSACGGGMRRCSRQGGSIRRAP